MTLGLGPLWDEEPPNSVKCQMDAAYASVGCHPPPYTGANTHKSKIPLKIRKYAFAAIAQFLGLIIQYGCCHGKNVNKHGRPHGKTVNKHGRLHEK